MIAHTAILDVSRDLAGHLAWLLHAERRRRGTRAHTRALSCFWQAVLGLRWLRDHTNPDKLGRDHQVSRATAYRYVDEVITVLADQAPDLHQALQQAHEDGHASVILDGTVVTTDRLAEKTTSVQGTTIDLSYSGKTGEHGDTIQALSAPNGFPLWVSDEEPDSTHDLTAAHEHVLPALYAAAAHGLPTLADGGYDGTGIGVHTPIKQPPVTQVLDADNRAYNALLRGLRSLGERGFALLTQRWRAMGHITASPRKIGPILQAALVLTQLEHPTT
ncbi:DDE superfamily endonuclease [Actinopolyspora lacussalsi subsp. righensis]|uniref:DDE superfamily endonuclease n=1 Tax=Actinopolyspora righensis TaxID=995060 RepID=A0A1I7BZU0_9ACTN|nr:transposase family protein [Actinopolyspora righensis]SFT92691.1 DDE superfamily endonuclease [Actinopolyspora righensis]